MNRRNAIKVTAASLAALALPRAGHAAEGTESPESKGPIRQPYDKQPNLASACGIYCGNCSEMKDGKCHGCGCTCGKCEAGTSFEHCSIAKCSAKKNITNCGDCKGFPCTKQINHTYDPVWRTQAVCMENLRRRKTIGAAAWIEEQKKYWSHEDNVKKWAFAEQEGKNAIEKLKKEHGYTSPF
jgi:hypothetical protein